MDLIDNYDDRSVSEVEDALDAQDFTDEELREIRSYEADNKNRTTLLEELDSRLPDDEDEDNAEADDSDADTDDELEEPSSRLLGSDTDADPVWISPRTSFVGEYSFRTLYSPKKVRRTRRVELAIDRGRAIEVAAPEE